MSNFEIDITNFQSITDGHLTFVPGVNVVVGQSNSGKTAILRAIQTNILNPKGSQRRIQHNKDESIITIKYLDNTISWIRTKKESSYEINGKPFKKAGTSNVFDYIDNTGFVVDDKDGLMNIEGELQLPFPFNRNPQELFKLFENLFSILRSSEVLKQFKSLEASRESEVSSLENEIQKYSIKYKAVKDLKEIVSLEKLNNLKGTLSAYVNIYNDKSSDLQILKKNKDLVLLSDFKEFDIDMKTPLDKYSELVQDIQTCCKTRDLYKVVKGLPQQGSVDLNKYLSLRADIINCRKIQNIVNLLNNAPSPITVPLVDYVNIRKDIISLNNYRAEGKACKDKLDRVKAEIEDIQSKIKEFKVCPLCGKELD